MDSSLHWVIFLSSLMIYIGVMFVEHQLKKIVRILEESRQ